MIVLVVMDVIMMLVFVLATTMVVVNGSKDGVVGGGKAIGWSKLPTPPTQHHPHHPTPHLQLYDSGYFGRGTVSRRAPNRGAFEVVVPPPEAAATAAPAAAATSAAAPAAKRPRLGGDDDGAVPPTLPPYPVPPPGDDALSALVTEWEVGGAARPLPEAYDAAATTSAHGQDVMRLDAARSLAHYISCPPPRVRHALGGVSLGGGSSGAPATSAAGTQPPLRVRAMRETAVLEPEAALFLLQTAPGRLAVYAPPEAPAWRVLLPPPPPDAGAAAVDAWREEVAVAAERPLSAQQLACALAAAIPNFSGRYATYATLRRGGWVPRDGSAFACDFVAYATGPGVDHAAHAVTIMPTAVVPAPLPPPPPPPAPATATAAGGEPPPPCTSASAPAPSPATMPPAPLPRPIVGTWLELHALSRVVSRVQKHTILAYPAVPAAAPTLCDDDVSRLRATTPTTVDATGGVACVHVSRWILSRENVNKTAAALRRVAAVAAAREVDIDLAVLEGGAAGVPAPPGGSKAAVRQAAQALLKGAGSAPPPPRPQARVTVTPIVLCPAYDDALPATNLHAALAAGVGSLDAATTESRLPPAAWLASIQHTALLTVADAALHAGAVPPVAVDSSPPPAAAWYLPSRAWPARARPL